MSPYKQYGRNKSFPLDFEPKLENDPDYYRPILFTGITVPD